jgi:20S proteasome subunit beta 1
MAVSYDGGVVLGADSRTSTGSYVANRATDKVTRIADTIYLCRSGSAADTQALAAAAATHLAQLGVELGRAPTVRQAAQVLASMAYQNKAALQAGMIVAGTDAVEGAAVYAIPLGGTLLSVPYAVGGSGSAYITGLCDKQWRPGMDRDAAIGFVRRAVAAAMARDGSSGGCIRTVAVDLKSGVERGFVPGDGVPPAFGEMGAAQREPVGALA